MTVLHISYQYGRNNTGGAAVAATRLHLAMLEKGVDSHYLCMTQSEPGPNVHIIFDYAKWFGWLYSFGKIKALWHYLGLPVPGFKDCVARINPDVIHVHWLNNGGPSLLQISKVKSEIVVNLHDSWMLTANTPVPLNDDRFITGYNRNNSSFVERRMFARKKVFFDKAKPIVIGPSQWICEQGKKSLLARHCIFFHVSNILSDEYLRSSSFCVSKKFTIVFGCYGGSKNRGKRFCDLVAALELIPLEIKKRMEVVVFGEDRECEVKSGVVVRYVGCIENAEKLCEIYSCGDLFAFPSLSETQGLTKMEAMACGLPVVAFDRTACAEGIEHGWSGWIAKAGDISDFAKGIMYFYGMNISGKLVGIRSEIKLKVKSKLSTDAIVDKILMIYKG